MPLLLRRRLLETYIWTMDKLARGTPRPVEPRSIFLLQPGHIGDLLVNTPIFDALRRKFPAARIVIGAGAWNAPTVQNNPNVDEFLPLNFPWHNKFVQPQGLLRAMKFIYQSPEVQALTSRRFDIGIDLFGSQFDALLMLRIGVGYRIGIRTLCNGHSAMHQTIPHDYNVRMGTMALQLARLLGATDLPPIRPQLFLTDEERATGQALWEGGAAIGTQSRRRIVVAPAAGMETRRWPREYFIRTVQMLMERGDVDIALVGGEDAVELCAGIVAASPTVRNFSGVLPLRQTFALISAADLTLSNSNMVVHVAAACGVPSIVVLTNSTPLARIEQALWGHETSRSFGQEVDHPGIYTPPEIVAVIGDVLDRSKGDNNIECTK